MSDAVERDRLSRIGRNWVPNLLTITQGIPGAFFRPNPAAFLGR